MFVFYAEKNRLYVMEKELITSGSANIYPVRFEFSPDWDGLERTAIFQVGCRKKSVPIVDGMCSVPAEVLSEPGRYLMMGVCGKQGESVVLPTVWANLGWIVEGAVPGGNPLPEDWQEALDGKGDTLAYTEEGELGLYSGDKLLSSVPIEGGGGEGVPGPQGEPGADATINGVNTLELEAGENIVLDQQGNRLTISSTGGVTQAELEEVLSGKQDVITPGDGLEKEGSTLSVSSPVQGVISQEEYDALPEERRNKGLYIVSGQRPGMRIYANGTMVEVLGERGPAGPDGSPIGTVISFMGSAAPEDYLVCDGGVHNIAEYPDLAEFFRKQFGAANHFGGDGEATFAVPDLRNLFLRGYHGEADEQLSGEIGEKQAGTIFPYILIDEGSFIQVQAAESRIENLDSVSGDAPAYKLGYTNKKGFSAPTQFTSRPANAAVLYCIKARTSAAAEDVYSLEERIVGRWIDGRPVYQKTLILNGITANSTSLSSIAIPTALIPADMDNILRYNGCFVRRSDNAKAMVPSHYLSVSCSKNVWVFLYSNLAGTLDGYLTIHYTKATDQPTIPLPEAEANVPQEDWPDVAEDEIVSEEI